MCTVPLRRTSCVQYRCAVLKYMCRTCTLQGTFVQQSYSEYSSTVQAIPMAIPSAHALDVNFKIFYRCEYYLLATTLLVVLKYSSTGTFRYSSTRTGTSSTADWYAKPTLCRPWGTFARSRPAHVRRSEGDVFRQRQKLQEDATGGRTGNAEHKVGTHSLGVRIPPLLTQAMAQV